MKVYEFRLSSPLELVDAAKLPVPSHAANSPELARNNPYPFDWVGKVTYDEAQKLAADGWTDAPKLGDIADRLTATETRTSHETQHAVTGAFVDVARFIEGHPECMMEFADEPAPRVVSVAVGISKLAVVSPESMKLAGAVAVAVLDTLSRSGMQVELSAFASTGTDRAKGITSFPIKRAHEPTDENQIAFWLCHPSALRMITFGFWDTCAADFFRDTNQSCGRARPLTCKAAELGADYVLTCSPSTEEEARRDYHRIIAEITAAL